jgi:hypothetical protein
MEIQSLIRLAHQADLEGNYRVADKLTERAIREAQFLRNIGRNIGDFFGNMNVGRGGRDIANQSLNIGTGPAVAGSAGPIQQAVIPTAGAAAQAVQKVKAKGTLRGPQSVRILQPDGSYVETPVAGNVTELLSNLDNVHPEDKGKISRFMPRVNATNQAGAAANASGAATAVSKGGDAVSGVTGVINKADRFKSHNISGITGPAAIGLTAVTAALGAYGMYLMNGKVVDQRGNPVPPDRIPDDIKSRIPQFQMMTRREAAGQISGGKALNAQNFIDANSSNPRLKNQRDWYNLALQTSGGDKNFANNVISFVKASPEMPSQVGGGPNI